MPFFEKIYVVSELDPFVNEPGVSTLGCVTKSPKNIALIDVPSKIFKAELGVTLKVHLQHAVNNNDIGFEEFDLCLLGKILSIKNCDNIHDGCTILQASVAGMNLILQEEGNRFKDFSIFDDICFCLKKL